MGISDVKTLTKLTIGCFIFLNELLMSFNMRSQPLFQVSKVVTYESLDCE